MTLIDGDEVIAQLEAKRLSAVDDARESKNARWFRERASTRALALMEAITVVAEAQRDPVTTYWCETHRRFEMERCP